jgi:serine/threonine protein kinase/class 3 adenylate cyclase/dipeptidyl aminopeptidase/acylaminoacyl peptidase
MTQELSRIDELLRARAEVEAEIRRMQAKVAVLFTDIVGSTSYFERYGDVAGLALVSRYAELTTKVIEEHGGRAVQTIGDAVMAELPSADAAVRAAVEVQRRLFRTNAALPERDRLQLRVGIHYGACFRQQNDLYGEAVNGAARITKVTGPAQILISRSVLEAIPSSSQFRFNRLGDLTLETQGQHEDIFEVVWMETDAYAALRHHTTVALRRGDLMAPGLNASELLQPSPPPPAPHTPPPAAFPTPQPEESLASRYELLGELGKGGMGIVYKARDRETGDLVALKVLRPELANDEHVMSRFKTEVRVARRITHKNVCRIHDFGRAGDTAYITMEIVEGESLRQILQRFGAMNPRKGLQVALQICAGLREAHAQGIVHRDLKPENVMIDQAGNVKLMDFGIARSSLGLQQTAAGMVIGTPAYMAPEQIRGEPVDSRADIYALGHILYEIFTGGSAFKGSTAMEIVFKQVQEQPPPPRQIEPTLPLHIEAAILRCLEKDPNRRFQTIEELEAALQGSPAQQAALRASYPTPPPMPAQPSPPAAAPTAVVTQPTTRVPTPPSAPSPAEQATVVDSAAAATLPTVVEPALGATQMQAPAAPAPSPAPVPAAVPSPPATTVYGPPPARKGLNPALIAVLAIIGFVGIGVVAAGAWWMLRGRLFTPASPPAEQAQTAPATPSEPPAQQAAEVPAESPAQAPPESAQPAPTEPSAAVSRPPAESAVAPASAPPSLPEKREPAERAPAPAPAPAANPPEPLRALPVYAFVRPLAGHSGGVTAVAFSADGRLAATGSADRTVRLWDVGAARAIQVLRGHAGNVTSVAVSPDGQWIASASLDRTVRIWSSGGGEIATLPRDSGAVLAVAFSPNGRALATANQQGEVKLWDPSSGQGLQSLETGAGPIYSLAFSPDGRLLATGGRDGVVRLWQASSGTAVRALAGHSDGVTSVAFSADGRTLASGSDDRTARLWNVSTGREIRALSGHGGSVNAVAFSPDGRVLATGSADKTIKLWDVSSGREAATLEGHLFSVTGLTFSRDGRWLASSSMDTTVRLWRRE